MSVVLIRDPYTSACMSVRCSDRPHSPAAHLCTFARRWSLRSQAEQGFAEHGSTHAPHTHSVLVLRICADSHVAGSSPDCCCSSEAVTSHICAEFAPRHANGCKLTHMIRPTSAVDTHVPTNAIATMAPMLRKKGFTCSENPASNMIGGSSARKKNSVCGPSGSCMRRLQVAKPNTRSKQSPNRRSTALLSRRLDDGGQPHDQCATLTQQSIRASVK